MSAIATVTLNPSLDEWIHLPSIKVGALNRASGFARYVGGKGINVSRVIRELKGNTQAFGFAGGDDGLMLREFLNDLKIPHHFVEIQGSTRNNYKIHTDSPRALTEINTAGPKVNRQDLRLLEQHWCTRRFSCVVFSGSLPPGVPDTAYREWISRIQERGIRTVLDASGKALKEGIKAKPWLIKPNRQEAEELLGLSIGTLGQAADAAVLLLKRGLKTVILSMASRGAVLAADDPFQVWRALPPAVSVNSAVGAGDSLVAGFVFGYFRKQSLPEAFRLGIACGAATATAPGTELCHFRDVKRLLPRVAVKQIA